MNNKRRESYPGAAFYITARGNHRNDIFRDEEDFQVYCSFLESAIKVKSNRVKGGAIDGSSSQ